MRTNYIPLIVIFAFVSCSTEAYLSVPGFPDMAKYFNTTEAYIQATLSLNLLAFCFASLFSGSLSDSFGRRKVLVLGFFLFSITSLGCVLTNSLNVLLLLRFLQGVGASTIWVISYAIIADLYQGREAVKYVSLLSAVSTLGIAIAPTAGALLCEYFGWRSTFACTATLSLISFVFLITMLPETIKQTTPMRLRNILRSYSTLLTSYDYMLHALTPSVLQAPYMLFISCASFLYISELGLSYEQYGTHLTIVIASYSMVSFKMKSLLKFFGEILLPKIGFSLSIISTILITPLAYYFPNNAVLMTACMTVLMMGLAICFCNVVPKTLAVFPNLKGAASALMMTTRMLFLSFGVWIGSALYTGRLVDTAGLITILTSIGLVFYYLTIRSSSRSRAIATA